jgi:hypothetical protein
MPKGPQGQKRPADVIGNAVHVVRIDVGEKVSLGNPNWPRGRTVARHCAFNVR